MLIAASYAFACFASPYALSARALNQPYESGFTTLLIPRLLAWPHRFLSSRGGVFCSITCSRCPR